MSIMMRHVQGEDYVTIKTTVDESLNLTMKAAGYNGAADGNGRITWIIPKESISMPPEEAMLWKETTDIEFGDSEFGQVTVTHEAQLHEDDFEIMANGKNE